MSNNKRVDKKLGPPLTWNEIANIYDKENSGRPARTLPMDAIFVWAKNQPDRFQIKDPEGTLHKIIKE